MKKRYLAVVATLIARTASADVPLFAAKCPSGITVDSNTKGQVYVNGKVAKLVNSPLKNSPRRLDVAIKT